MSKSVPSLISFDGDTVADLIEFLQQYPNDYGVVFQDECELVAKAKADYVILRLDPPWEK